MSAAESPRERWRITRWMPDRALPMRCSRFIPAATAAIRLGSSRINAWLRSTDIFDKVFDVAAAVQNPLDEEYYRPGTSLDNIHPSDSGQYLIAKSIDAQLVMKAAERARPRPAKP